MTDSQRQQERQWERDKQQELARQQKGLDFLNDIGRWVLAGIFLAIVYGAVRFIHWAWVTPL